MSSDFSSAELEALTDGTSITYGVVKPGDEAEDGIPFVRGGDVLQGKVLIAQLRTITKGVSAQYARTLLRGGELLVSLVGNPGEVAIAPAELSGANIARQVGLVRIDPKKADPNYVQFFLRSRVGRDLLLAHSKGSVQQVINLRDLKSIRVPLPSLVAQQEVSKLMQSFDDRITHLRETNATLEAIAQALFKSWFVDFDPVRAKSQGLAPAGIDESTAALFPDGLEVSALGPVPQGWTARPFTDAVRVVGGGTPKTSVPEYWGGDIPWFSVIDAPSGNDTFVVATEKSITKLGLENCSAKLLRAGTTIISARGTVGRLALVGREMAMNQSCYALQGNAGDAYFTYFTTKGLVAGLKQRSHGSVFDTITRETLASVSVAYPPEPIILCFELAVGALMERIKENLLQAQTLASLRDALLPRLIAGQLRLPDAERLVEAAAA